MKTQDERGMLTEAIQEKAKKFLGREIDTTELRLYPYLDFCWKNGGSIDINKLSTEEYCIFGILEKHQNYFCGYIEPTREFYDFVQDILAESYVIFCER